MSPEIAKLEAATAVFEAKKAGILEAIKHKRRRAQDTAGEERELEALVGHAPVPPLIPRLLYADATPEALAHALVTGWPSGGVLSAEAGALLERAGTLPRAALAILAERGRARMEDGGRRRTVAINPALLVDRE